MMDIWTNKKVSPQGKLNSADLKKWLLNALIFLGPALLVLIPSVIELIPAGWKYGAIALYFLNLLTDIIKKLLDGKK